LKNYGDCVTIGVLRNDSVRETFRLNRNDRVFAGLEIRPMGALAIQSLDAPSDIDQVQAFLAESNLLTHSRSIFQSITIHPVRSQFLDVVLAVALSI
jgi:hypothetical protein